jgi:CHASE2 domain-containing sensor protein
MQKKGVKFASPAVPVQFGLAVRGHVGDGSLVRVAAAVAGTTVLRGAETVRIDPRLYLTGLTVAPIQYLPQSFPESLAENVVFFGAAYGTEGDLFLTPIGEVYGVELHAATFESRQDPTRVPGQSSVDLVLDLAFGWVFGFVSWCCWAQYFKAVGDEGAARQLAGLWVLLLVTSYVLLVIASLGGATALLARFGIWLSPVPIAVGMFVDGFVSGAPGAANPR